MKRSTNNSIPAILFLFALAGLSGCGNSKDAEEKVDVPLYTEGNSIKANIGDPAAIDETEGPQYQTPTMDVLEGKPQHFPAKFPVKRYPHARVEMVDVRPGRPPGYKNMVLMKTADQMPQISTFYKQNLALDNWKLVGVYANECYESTHWVKGDQECEVRISPDLRTADKKYVQLLTGLRIKKPPIGGSS